MPPSLEGRVRRLEREYARELAEIKVRRFCELLTNHWADFADSDYRAWDLMEKMGITHLGLPRLSAVASVIDRAKRGGYTLDLSDPFDQLIPWATRPLEDW